MIEELGIFVRVLRPWVEYFFMGCSNLAIKLGEGGAFLLFIKVGGLSLGTSAIDLNTLLAEGSASFRRWIE